ncbi:MAG TPA: S1 RNA-binding domain-containing protein [Candidatus Scatomonas merdigallinarum]|nr:S1 RNA-binding domain-containing protein [Candidatus Scatomonas merdigallinarum]
MADENLTMDDFSEAVDQSFDTFKDEDQEIWEKMKQYRDEKTPLTVTVDGVVNKGVISNQGGIRCFIPASRLALGHVADLNEYLGKEIQVRVTEVDQEKGRVILSARELLREKAQEEKKARIAAVAVGTVMDGTVETLQPYGAFVKLENGLSGLVHVSQISHTRIKDPSVVLKVGDSVKVKVIAVKDGKLSLSMKALEEDTAAREEEELRNIKLPKSEELTTSLGELFKNIKL